MKDDADNNKFNPYFPVSKLRTCLTWNLSLIHICGKLAEIKFCPSIEETTAEVMKALEA